jgi:hypothetical protein
METCASCNHNNLPPFATVDTQTYGRICLGCARDKAGSLAQQVAGAASEDSNDASLAAAAAASDLAAIVLAGAGGPGAQSAPEDVTRLPGGSVIYWMTLPLTDMNPNITVRISTSALADLVIGNASEEARQDLIESLCD